MLIVGLPSRAGVLVCRILEVDEMRKLFRVFGALLLCAALATAVVQEQPPALDGPKKIFRDELLDKMVGTWKLTGKVAGQTADHIVEAAWVLNHQFLRIHEKAVARSSDGMQYEAMVFVGYDNASERYVAHWIDVFGARASETLGYGSRTGDAIRFVFEYADGPFHTTFRWNAGAKTWQWLMKGKDKSGQWVEFGDMTLTRQPEP
jgi:Protein of unknown function (DUF1579)